MHIYNLKNDWKLRFEELFRTKEYFSKVLLKKDGWMDVKKLPCDVHVPLINEGIIKDPIIGENCYDCEWIEDKSWWFMKTFCIGKEFLSTQISELLIEGLDVKADLFLNDCYIGHHKSQTYSFRKDIKDIIKQGENILIIRVTSGLEYFSELEMSGLHWKNGVYASNRFIRDCGTRRDDRRIFLRKPQYVYGWDWNPRIATCGIMGDARIEAFDEIAIRDAKFTTKELFENSVNVCIEAEIEYFCPISTIDVNVEFELYYNDKSVYSETADLFAKAGINFVSINFNIKNPKLWWPNGMGEQNLYNVKINAITSNNAKDFHEFKTGIRTVKINTERLDKGRMFAFEVNGVSIFSKGGNWVAADSVYGRVTNDKYEKLVKEAKEANFNMLRFNGVGAYEREYFYECCDKYGILIWQDFLFSCAAYPDHLEWFRKEAENEVSYQIKRLRNHPCIALWSGNNECQNTIEGWGRYSYFDEKKKASFPMGMKIYNQIMPRLVRELCPDIQYWNSSPFGGSYVDNPEYGDTHSWGCFMNKEMNKRITLQEYDKIKSRFVSEFGCVGPTKKTSLIKYYGNNDIVIGNNNWDLHTNEFEKGTIKEAISKHYMNADNLSIDEYLLYAGLFQGLMLGYAYESFRCLENNYGALLWSYNDCRGEIGWSIIDYYLVRKISFYFVKRALEHTKLVMRENDGIINIMCMNDTSKNLDFEIEYGCMTFSGVKKETKKKRVSVQPFCKSIVIAQIPKEKNDIYYVKAEKTSGIRPAILADKDFKDMKIEKHDIRVLDFNKNDKKIEFVVSTEYFAHAVHFKLDDDVLLSDEYFDLLPGELRRITLEGSIESIVLEDIKPKGVYTK